MFVFWGFWKGLSCDVHPVQLSWEQSHEAFATHSQVVHIARVRHLLDVDSKRPVIPCVQFDDAVVDHVLQVREASPDVPLVLHGVGPWAWVPVPDRQRFAVVRHGDKRFNNQPFRVSKSQIIPIRFAEPRWWILCGALKANTPTAWTKPWLGQISPWQSLLTIWLFNCVEAGLPLGPLQPVVVQ